MEESRSPKRELAAVGAPDLSNLATRRQIRSAGRPDRRGCLFGEPRAIQQTAAGNIDQWPPGSKSAGMKMISPGT
jgi:hypothetical protein